MATIAVGAQKGVAGRPVSFVAGQVAGREVPVHRVAGQKTEIKAWETQV